ncbi:MULTISPECIES: hypothetical protein [unclassified Sphingomonas]|uniref:hypothetical protein n=1 Tax=unclassified Sphingomonas TaxID=196159 RepID=UPI00226AB640|nr:MULTISPECIES: hypothetical protein [unclassified Sphingomonas]
MRDSSALIARLRRVAAGTGPAQADPRPMDAWLAGGLHPAQLHEIHAAEANDGAAVAGFAVALALAAGATPLLWLRTRAAERQSGRLHATGLFEMGLSPHALVLAVVEDEAALLRAAADGARCAGLGTLLVEAWGPAPGLDLTATRRLMLAAEASGVAVLVLRVGAGGGASAAASRWSVSASPSAALEADAPGRPAFDVECVRRRGGPAGQRWCVEWNRDDRCFDPAPLSGARLPLAPRGAAAQHPRAPVRRTG